MSFFRRMASRVDDWLDRRRSAQRGRGKQTEPVIVVPYPGWGTADEIHLRGSVVEQSAVEKPGPADSIWEDLSVTLGRFTAAEIMDATVRVSYGDVQVKCQTDSDGFFEATLPNAPVEAGWVKAIVRLEDFPGRTQDVVEVEAPILVPELTARFGVISDIDDTVIRTGISEPLKNWRTIVESDAESRVAFPGLAELYQGLERGGGRQKINPIFYVSSGSWRLYDLIAKFKRINTIPRGPVFMDDWGLDETRWFKSSHGKHKKAAIKTILKAYPDLPFILVGDSGQHDAEIYAQMVRKHGKRIQAIWIRDVSGGARDAQVSEVLREAREAGVAVFAEPDLAEAAKDAAAKGWISASDLSAVEAAIAEAGEVDSS